MKRLLLLVVLTLSAVLVSGAALLAPVSAAPEIGPESKACEVATRIVKDLRAELALATEARDEARAELDRLLGTDPATEQPVIDKARSQLEKLAAVVKKITVELDAKIVIRDRDCAGPVITPPPPPAVFFPDCDAVREAKALPLLFGDPGYRPELDQDGDGVACETVESAPVLRPAPPARFPVAAPETGG